MGTVEIKEVLVEAELILLFSILATWDSGASNLFTNAHGAELMVLCSMVSSCNVSA